MNRELQAKWDESALTDKPVPVGDLVCCDFCSDDYTKSSEPGGFIFESKAVCPKCAARIMRSIIEHQEQRFIRANCPPGQSFADFVRHYRGPDAFVRIHKKLPQ